MPTWLRDLVKELLTVVSGRFSSSMLWSFVVVVCLYYRQHYVVCWLSVVILTFCTTFEIILVWIKESICLYFLKSCISSLKPKCLCFESHYSELMWSLDICGIKSHDNVNSSFRHLFSTFIQDKSAEKIFSFWFYITSFLLIVNISVDRSTII